MKAYTVNVSFALARSLGHLPGPLRTNGVMDWAECQRCRGAMVSRRDDGKGFTGSMVSESCGSKP